jgi:hypothetical protein
MLAGQALYHLSYAPSPTGGLEPLSPDILQFSSRGYVQFLSLSKIKIELVLIRGIIH